MLLIGIVKVLPNEEDLVLSNGKHWKIVHLHNEIMDMIQCTDYKSLQRGSISLQSQLPSEQHVTNKFRFVPIVGKFQCCTNS